MPSAARGGVVAPARGRDAAMRRRANSADGADCRGRPALALGSRAVTRELRRRAWRGTPRSASRKSGCSMQRAWISTSASSAASRSIAASRSSICLVTASANDGPAREPLRPARASASTPSPRHDAVVEPDPLAPSRRRRSRRSSAARAARPRPTMRGSSHEAPMSAPERPTFVNRNAIFARLGGDAQVAGGGDHRARARHGAVQRRDDRPPAAPHRADRASPVMRVKSSRPCASRANSSPMMSSTSPPEQNARPAPVSTIGAHAGLAVERVERVAQLARRPRRSARSAARAGRA